MSVSKLTAEQQAIVLLRSGCYLVDAPPGSGKTTVVAHRAVNLLEQDPSESFRVLLLTYTALAAERLRARIRESAVNLEERATCSTFHSFCLEVLQHYGEGVGVAPDSIIYSKEEDRLEALAQGLADDGFLLDHSNEDGQYLRHVLESISRLKRDLVPASAAPTTGTGRAVSLRDAYTAYDRTLRRNGALDFDDLFLLTYKVFAGSARVARHYRRMYRYILIDEAQDMGRAQYEVLKALCGDEHRNVMLLADSSQSMYSFAGASAQYLESFQKDFGAKRYSLTQSFRSAAAIVRATINLLVHGQESTSLGKATFPSESFRGRVTAKSYEDEEAEGIAVAERVGRWISTGLSSPSLYPGGSPILKADEICVLARNRYHLKETIKALRHRGIAYRLGAGEFGGFDSEFFRTIYRAMMVAVRPHDLLARENLIAEYSGVTEEQGRRLRELDVDELFAALSETATGPQQEVAEFFIHVGGSLGARHETDGDNLVNSICQLAEALPVENEMLKDLQDSDAKYFREKWKAYRLSVLSEKLNLRSFLAELSSGRRHPEGDEVVRVLTVQAAKGLEFRAVILVGMNEGDFPDFRNFRHLDGIAAERRIAYVAITRATRRLLLTRPRFRHTYSGQLREYKPSRFLKEMQLDVRDD